MNSCKKTASKDGGPAATLSLAVFFLAVTLMVFALPLAGVLLRGGRVGPYLRFPPEGRAVVQPPFSWTFTLVLGAVLLAFILPFLARLVSGMLRPAPEQAPAGRRPFPVWGWGALLALVLCWTLAWSRIPAFRQVQHFTFFPLWLSFILTVNALLKWRTGRSFVTDEPGRFVLLFLASAAYWWYFEYLNRFVNNWYYDEDKFYAPSLGPFWYTLDSTVAFSTVLPGVMSVQRLILSFPRLRLPFEDWRPLPGPGRGWGLALLALSAIGLLGIGCLPVYFYPLLWACPGLVILALQIIFGKDNILRPASAGNWSGIVSASLAALSCGFCWELWNFFSSCKWFYRVPFSQRFHIFEMPLLGYGGYIPFGLECLIVYALLSKYSLGAKVSPGSGLRET